MDFKIARLDGSDVMKDSVSGIYYTAKEWRQLTTDDTSTNVSGYHGRRTSPTFARKRVIRLEGLVQRSGNTNEFDAVSYLQDLFNLQSNTGSVEARQLYIKDMYDDEWILDVKVRDPILFLEYDGDWTGVAWKWAVTLESIENPEYKSYVENEESGIEGLVGGFRLPVIYPLAFNETLNKIECNTTGNTATPARVEISVINATTAPLKISNVTDGTFFALDIVCAPGDVVIVDSETQTATKNGVSVIASRVVGSIFPTILGTTEFVVSDLYGMSFDSFTISIFYRDALLA